MSATAVAAVIVFGGLLLDMPSVKRVKALEVERHALDAEITLLTGELDGLAVERSQAEEEAEQLGGGALADPRFASVMRELTAIERTGEVQVVSVRPAPAASGTAVAVELNAPLRILGPYLDALERSRWALKITDLHLMRNPNAQPSISARFTVSTSETISGLASLAKPGEAR